MDSNDNNGSPAAWARGFMALFAMLAMGLGLTARPAEAAPFAYVANQVGNEGGTVSVIDTGANPPVVVGPRSRWGFSPMRSPSPRMENMPMS